MRHVDFTPLYRSTVGFDRLFTMIDKLGQVEQSGTSYPPYNIERTGEANYRITMAVAGFAEDELEIESNEGVLSVKGEKQAEDKEGVEVLFQGIAARSFERRFQLADHVEVRTASMEHGLLHIDLVREVPEAMKPRKVAISTTAAKQIEGKAKTEKAK